MNAWLLILTITLAGADRSGSAITQIGPFENKEACLQAANSWIQQQQHIAKVSYAPVPRALCVRQF